MTVYLVIQGSIQNTVILRTALSYTHFSKSVCTVLYVRTCEVGRCTLDHLASLSEKKVAVGERRGAPQAAQLHKKKSQASANLQRTITQTAASAGGTLLTHRKLSWYYLCCLDLPQGFPLSSFIFPQSSFSLNLPNILPTKGQTCS